MSRKSLNVAMARHCLWKAHLHILYNCNIVIGHLAQVLRRSCTAVVLQETPSLRGPGGSKSSLLLFLTEGSVSYQILFTRLKNIVHS